MWIGVGSVSVVTILFQLFVANSIIAPPIQTLAAVVRRMQGGDYTARGRTQFRRRNPALG